MIRSSCICKEKGLSSFRKYLDFQNVAIFREYSGIIIGKCDNCGILKTIPSKKSAGFNPEQSRGEYYDFSEEKFTHLFLPIINVVRKNVKGGNILDVGCSSGILLSLLKKAGNKVWGIEPNKKAFKKAETRLGSTVFLGNLSHFKQKNKIMFDCIIYNHVLEHIKNPEREILSVRKILKQGGLMIVGVPNTRNIIFFLRRKYWESLMPKEHVWHFTDKYLIDFFGKLGFKLKERFYSNHNRSDYPLLKKIYFNFLILLNKVFQTGESVLLIFKNQV